MCGILGGTNRSWNYEAAIESISHRGPDGRRIEALDKVTLGFARLSIRDLSIMAMQPMYSSDKQVALVYNGEIYGYGKLKSDLLKRGCCFRTNSDTEVILNAYLTYGEKFINHIDGMFAIAIYDKQKEKLFLYRDRMGIKPLFYYYNGKDFMFASELKAILKMEQDRKFERDKTAIYDYFTYRYIPEPKTLFQEICKIEPAMKLIFSFSDRKLIKEKYWRLKVSHAMGSNKKRTEDIYEKVKSLIGKSVEEQLVADVPVGTFLSGGIDSSIVSAEIYNRTKNVQAFSMGFQVFHPSEKEYDETKYAELLARVFQFPITTGQFDRSQLKMLRRHIREWYDEPFADTSCYPTYMISRMAKENRVPVILTGDGGDEVFGGYTRYAVYQQKVKERPAWTLLCDFYTKILKSFLDREEFEDEFLDAVSLFAREAYAYTRSEKKAYIRHFKIGCDYDDFWYFRKYYHEELPPVTRAQYIDFKTYLPADILTKVDRAAMQNSIETRVPLLSKELVEFAFGLSQEERCPGGELKGLLKKAYEDIIPKEILYKSKKGFSFPGSYWQSDKEERFLLWQDIWEKHYQ